MVGVLENPSEKMTMDFKQPGDIIYLIGKSSNDINSSEYLHKIHGIEFSPAPEFELDNEYNIQRAIAKLIKDKIIQSAHDVSEGGLFITLTESGLNRSLGYDITSNKSVRKDAFLFGEAQSRVVISILPVNEAPFMLALQTLNIPFEKLGLITEETISIDNENWGNITDWKVTYDNAIEQQLKEH